MSPCCCEGIGQPAERHAINKRWRASIQALLDGRPPIDNVDQARDMLDLLRAPRDGGESAPLDAAGNRRPYRHHAGCGCATTALGLYWTATAAGSSFPTSEAVRRELCQGPLTEPPSAQTLRSSRIATAFLYEKPAAYPPATSSSVKQRRTIRSATFAFRESRHDHLSWPRTGTRALAGSRPLRPQPLPPERPDKYAEGLDALRSATTGLHRCSLCDYGDPRDPSLPAGRYRISLLGAPPLPVGRVTLLPDRQPLFRLTAL